MTDSRPDEVTDADDVRDVPKTSANQAKTEAMPPSPVATAPDFADPSGDRQPEPADVPPILGEPPVPSPGNIFDESHIAVSTYAAAGTSEQTLAAEGVSATAVAQPGKPDGEVAT